MRISGVYKISNIKTGDVYIGSAVNMNKRKGYHFWQLKRSIHCNPFLQKSYNKYGANAFSFEVLNICPPESCIKQEQLFVNKYSKSGYRLFNICKIAGSVFGRKHSEASKVKIGLSNKKNVMSDEQKQHLRNINLGKKKSIESVQKGALKRTGIKMSESAKIKISISNKNKPKSESHKAAMSEAQKNSPLCGRRVAKYDRDGNFVCAYDKIVHAAKDVNSAYGNICQNLSGARKTVRGFIFKYI